MIYLAYGLLLVFALMFSAYERRLWGTGKTPFAFAAYPFLAMLALAVFVAPGMGFFPLHVETLFVSGLFFALVALASVAMASLAHDHRRLAGLEQAGDGRSVARIEYLALGGLLAVMFLPGMLRGQVINKGELGAGGIGGHIIEIGIAYLVIAASQRRGQPLVRLGFTLLMLWLLAFNQVKYLILLPLSAAVLYRWASGQLATWKLVVIGLLAPLTLVVFVYAFFGLTLATQGVALTPALVIELAKHMVSYLVAGVVGLDQLLLRYQTSAFGSDGLAYVFAPFVNLARVIVGNHDYVSTVKSIYPIIHADGITDSNVFTLFGSLVYRAGWVGAVGLSLACGLISYWWWARWRTRTGALASAAGSWWMATLLFAWFDPLFTSLTIVEVMVIHSIRGRVRLPDRLTSASWPDAARRTASPAPCPCCIERMLVRPSSSWFGGRRSVLSLAGRTRARALSSRWLRRC
jgi:hypothetical protein